MTRRKPRNKIDKDEVDMLQPLKITDFGTSKDPCFGKLHDLKASECMRCGDSEICSIICAQKMNLERLQIEAKTPFKDTLSILNTPTGRKEVRGFIRKKLKKYPKDIEKVIKLTHKKFQIPLKKCRVLTQKLLKK